MIKQLVYNLLSETNRNNALRQLRSLEQALPSSRSRFAIPFVFRGWGHFKLIKPRQNPVEIEALYEVVSSLRPARVLEIGTARGGTLYLWTQAAADNATLVSVDLPGGDFGGAYPECRMPFYQAFAARGQQLFLERADSHSPETLELIKQRFAGEPVDFAFIDGDHTYEGVKADFENYGPLVRPGGIIAFHDILYREDQPSIRVDRLWNELKEHYECHELVGPEGSGKRIGIGYLRVPEAGLGL